MKICALTYAAAIGAIGAVPASAEAPALVIDLLPGHPVYHERAREAGVVMAISITPGEAAAVDLRALCEELRVAAGLRRESSDGVPLEVIFVVPYKGLAIEGYYLPADGAPGGEALIQGNAIARTTLEGIVARGGFPAGILDETEVEHEISCELGEPAWLLRWEDIRPVEGEQPDTVIDSAHRRFMTLHRSVVEHNTGTPRPADLRVLGLERPAPSLAFTNGAPAPGALPQASQ
jgi:hypothetical protein